MSSWKTGTSKRTNALSGTEGQPLISEGGSGAVFLGRVVIEVWDQADLRAVRQSYPGSLAYQCQMGALTLVTQVQLLQHVAKALPARVADDAPYMEPD